jgi:hypothetical protein
MRVERKQGRHLKKHLRGPRQRTFRRAIDGLPPLRGEAQGLLNAHNEYARGQWFRAFAGNLSQELRAEPPRFYTPEPVYFVTVTDQRQIVYPDYEEEDNPSIPTIRQIYAELLSGLNYVGMLDPALYVSTQKTHGVNRFILFHVHALVWGIDQKQLDEICNGIRRKIKPLLPYASSVDDQPITQGTLLQVISYTIKMPRDQYQLWERTRTRSYQQYKRGINGVNSVRLYGAMRDVRLDQLAVSGGRGDRVLRRVYEDLLEWRLEISTLEWPELETYHRI